MKLSCKECGVERSESEFFKNSSYKNGYATNRCRPCRVLYRKAHRDRDRAINRLWREQHPDYMREYNAKHYAQNKEKNDARVKAWRKVNPSAAMAIEKRKYYRAKALGKIRPRQNKVSRDRYAKNPEYLWRRAARRAVIAAIKTCKLAKRPCEACGTDKKVDGHHHKGYEFKYWLDVQWLCRKHHREAHGKNYWG